MYFHTRFSSSHRLLAEPEVTHDANAETDDSSGNVLQMNLFDVDDVDSIRDRAVLHCLRAGVSRCLRDRAFSTNFVV